MDLGEAGGCFFGDGGGERGFYGAGSVFDLLVLGYGVLGLGRGWLAYRCNEKILDAISIQTVRNCGEED